MNNFLNIALSAVILVFMLSCNSNPENEKTGKTEQKISVTDNKEPKKEIVAASEPQKSNEAESAESEPFNYLEKMNIDKQENIYLKYNQKMAEVFNKKIQDLPKNDPLRSGEGYLKLIKTKINSSGQLYYVVFSWGPSADPNFQFYKDSDLSRPAFTIYALQVFIPGNGYIYSSGHTNNMFNTRKKYTVENNSLKEIEQAFYYVGLKTKTLEAIKLYRDEQLVKIIANLPKDYNVEVLINKPGTNLFLIKTDFGLTGWIKPEMRGRTTQIDKLYYAGD